MQRIDTATKAVDLFGPGKHGFTGGDPVSGVPATRFSDAWCNSLQEEVAHVIESTGTDLDANSNAQLLAAIQAIIAASIPAMPDPIPVGTILWVPGTVALPGTIKSNGALLSRASYADLWAYAQASGNIVSDADWTAQEMWGAFSTGDGATTFRIPDPRGVFFRAYDDGRGFDSGRVIGSHQADLLRDHTHNYERMSAFANERNDGAGSDYRPNGSATSSGVNGGLGGAETRPRNIAWLACIKY